MEPYFIWKGEDSRDWDLWVTELPAPTRAAERTEEITIPGRAGSLMYKEGENVHEAYMKECVVTTRSERAFSGLLTWLSGQGEVIFSNEPDRAYKAEIVAEIAFDKVSNSLKQATIPFYVHPHKAQYPPEAPITLAADGAVYNPGTVASKPCVQVTFTERGGATINGTAMRFIYPAVGRITLDTWDIDNGKEPFYATTTANDETTVTKKAHIQIKDADSNVVSEWDTTDKPHDITVSDGVYTVHVSEITQPSGAGYLTPNDLAFEVLDGKLLYSGTTLQITDADKHTGDAVVIGNDNSLVVQFSTSTADNPVSNPTLSAVTVTVDCDAQIITDTDGIWRGASIGDFWQLSTGTNTVTLTDATVSIQPRWRWY